MSNTVDLFMRTKGGSNVSISQEKVDSLFNKKDAKYLWMALTQNSAFYYAKANKRQDNSKDYIVTYNVNARKYLLFPVEKVARCIANLDDSSVDKAIKRIEGVMKKQAKQEEQTAQEGQLKVEKRYDENKSPRQYAEVELGGKLLVKSLEARPLSTILEFNVWLDIAYNELHIKAPKSEAELTDRYLKTLKIYSIAFQVGHNLPVAILRSLLREMTSDCHKVTCIKDRQSALSVLHSNKVLDTSTKSKSKSKSKAKAQSYECTDVEVKCQVAYPASAYNPTELITGIVDVQTGEVVSESVLGESVMFVTKLSRSVVTSNSVKQGDKLLAVYVPYKTQPEECNNTEDDLITVAYEMAISLNYPLARVLFR